MESAAIDQFRVTRVEPPEPREATPPPAKARTVEPPPRPPEPQPGTEVEISERARELRAANTRALEQHLAARRAATEAMQGRSAEQPVERAPVLAVRTGPAPVQAIVKDPETVIRETLAERAGVRDLSAVLRQEERVAAPPVELLGGHASERELAPLPLLGEDRAGPELRTRALPGAGPAAELPAPPPAVETRRPRERVEESERHVAERGEQRYELDRASSLASQTGGVSGADNGRADSSRVELLGERDQPAGEKIAHHTLTQAGAVEADSESEIVSRMFDGTSNEDAGPTPRNREDLGSRSQPLSTYA